MSDIQKVIKYFAISLAFVLIFSIIYGIICGVSTIDSIFGNEEQYEINAAMNDLKIDGDIKNLELDIKSSNIFIKIGDKFKVETSNKYIKHKLDGNTLYIRENRHNFFNKKIESELVIYIPENMMFEKVNISNGAGRIEIEKLSTKVLDLDLGAGKVEINNLEVLNNTIIDGGVGEATINNGILNNLDLDIGVGKFTLNVKLLGSCEIDHGVGEANFNLIGSEQDYQIHVSKGIGSATIDGKAIKNDDTIGTGVNKIDIDGGVGSIVINFEEGVKKERSFTKTYKLLNIVSSNEEDAYYLTLQLFQGEVDTILVRNIEEDLEAGKNYEFSFKTNSNDIEDNIKSIFNNSTISSIRETSKNGLEQVQDSIW